MRAVHDDDERIRFLKLRLEALFINSCQVLYTSKSAFPLVTMTCIGIEALASTFEVDRLDQPVAGETAEEKDQRKKRNKKRQQTAFVQVCNKLDGHLSRQLTKKFRKALAVMWPNNSEISEINTPASLIHRYLRNEMVHGFQAKGVYLSYEDTDKFIVDEKGYMVINPGWFWVAYEKVFKRYFDELATEGSMVRKNCLLRINDMLS